MAEKGFKQGFVLWEQIDSQWVEVDTLCVGYTRWLSRVFTTVLTEPCKVMIDPLNDVAGD